MQFLGSTGCQLAIEKGTDLGRAHIEQFGQGPRVVTMSGQCRLKGLQIGGQNALDDLDCHWILTDQVAGLERQGEVLLDLQRCRETVGQTLEGLLGQDVGAV